MSKDFKCSKCGFETGSLVSLEWHVTTSECPKFEEKPKNKTKKFLLKLLKRLFLSMVVSGFMTCIVMAVLCFVYGSEITSFFDGPIHFIIYTVLLMLILD